MPYILLLAVLAQTPADPPAHDSNLILKAAIDRGLEVGDVAVKLPEPTFRDGMSAEEQKTALAAVAGSSRGADEMLQPSLSAPHKLRLQDQKTARAVVRSGDLVFTLRGVDLDSIRPAEAIRQFRSEPVDAGNMRFQLHILTTDEAGKTSAPPASDYEWLSHAVGRLLDRIAVESTDRISVSRSDDSLILASRTDPTFGPDGVHPNRWSTVTMKAGGDVVGPPQPYAGGVGYMKLTRLRGQDKALLVEAHFAFAEPTAWFDGAPILRSKLGLIAQDQVRRLRRELSKTQK